MKIILQKLRQYYNYIWTEQAWSKRLLSIFANKESLQNWPASWRSTDENKKIRNRMIREHRIIKLSILYLHLSASYL